MSEYIQDFYPAKAQFIAGENIKLILELKNDNFESKKLILKTDVLFLGNAIDKIHKELELEPFEAVNIELLIPAKQETFKGYGADVCLFEVEDDIDADVDADSVTEGETEFEKKAEVRAVTKAEVEAGTRTKAKDEVQAETETKAFTIGKTKVGTEMKAGNDTNTNTGILVGSASTAFDVVDSYKRAVRYGFLSDFYSNELGKNEDLKNICKLHLNVVQFYDWMYRHDELVPPQNEYMDLMGRTLSLDVVKEKISNCHEYGMKAIAYGAVYAAAKDFYEKHTDWALYDSNNKVLSFINIFYIMNITEKSPWHNHILAQYRKAVSMLDFDGIHMDTYGFPKTAMSRLGNFSDLVYLDEHLPILINHAKTELVKVKPEVCIIFNNVGNWPVKAVSGTNQEAVYIEVWSPYERYHHLASIIKEAKIYGDGKPVVLAAYMKPFIEGSTTVEEGYALGVDTSVRDSASSGVSTSREESDSLGGNTNIVESALLGGNTSIDESALLQRAQIATLLATAAIVSNGAFQLILGEDKGILTQGYYVDYTVMQSEFFAVVRTYYDFIVRYSNIFYENSLIDVSMTHTGGDNLEYVFRNGIFSSYGEANKIWTVIKENKNFKTISLINLIGNNDDYWNKGKNNPASINDIEVSIQVDRNVKAVFTASPDFNNGKEELLDYEIVDGCRGRNLTIKMPELHIWRILWIEFE